MISEHQKADFIDEITKIVRQDTSPDQNSIVCLRPSPTSYHPVKYTGKYAKTISMYPPSLMPPSCNGQATWLNRDGKHKQKGCKQKIKSGVQKVPLCEVVFPSSYTNSTGK